jgi:hypothetical protein
MAMPVPEIMDWYINHLLILKNPRYESFSSWLRGSVCFYLACAFIVNTKDNSSNETNFFINIWY